MSDTLSVVVLNSEGDQFNASYIAEGKPGGVQASSLLYSAVKDRLIKREGIDSSSLIVYLVADRKRSFTFPDKRIEAFFEGFGSTENPCFVVEPIENSSSSRVTQLLDLYLPLESTSSVFLGSLHNSHLNSYLIALPPQQKNKITLLSTVAVAPCYRQLTQEGWFKASTEFESLFGELLTPDVAAKMLWDSVEVSNGNQAQEEDQFNGNGNGNGNGMDIWSNSNETSWRAEDNPISSSSKALGLIWDDESDDDLPSWDRESQLRLTPPLSPQQSPQRSSSISPVSDDEPIKKVYESFVSPSVSSRPPESSSILARAQQVTPLPARPPTYNAPVAPTPTPPRHMTAGTHRPTVPIVPSRPVAIASSNPLPIKPVPIASSTSKSTLNTATSTTTTTTTIAKEVITQTPQGPVSSLPAYHVPNLSFAYTEPCKRFYLRPEGCPQSAQSCRFSHSFPFTVQEKQLFPLWSKGTICLDATRGKCKKGEDCYQGHRCNYTASSCRFGSTCKFKLAGLPHSSRKN